MAELTYEQLIGTVAVILLLLGAYNVAMTAWKNKREAKAIHDEPFEKLKARVDMLEKDNEKLKFEVEELKKNSRDLQTGLMTICEGVQALLNHSLADGNEDEMRGAAGSISKWLRGR